MRRPQRERAPLAARPLLVKHSRLRQALYMSDAPGKSDREDRLAAKLRENLRKRKAQARHLSRDSDETGSDPLPKQQDGG